MDETPKRENVKNMQENNTGSTVVVLTPADMRAHSEPQRLREKQKAAVNIQKKSDAVLELLTKPPETEGILRRGAIATTAVSPDQSKPL